MMNDDIVSSSTPLLRGGSRQTVRDPLTKNLWRDVAPVAQLGIFALVVVIWYHVLSHDLILFSGHPLFQSLAVLFLTQALLVLQPTHEPEQKRQGQRAHAILNLITFLLLVAGVTIIEVNKIRGNGPHFHSVHGYLGIITSIVILLQYLVGFTMWAVPQLYGGVDNAKSLYKYHRVSGYSIYLLLLATILSAVWTDYNNFVLGLRWWYLAVPIVVAIVGLFLRIDVSKFGFRRSSINPQ